jgi:hypothetical protein
MLLFPFGGVLIASKDSLTIEGTSDESRHLMDDLAWHLEEKKCGSPTAGVQSR